ncbi:MAG: ATP-binding cassette domain-containing protein, partial [Holosporales bacterium]|nr:ATP-binding cassette domain-containing protein [Holosporales bacterium]
MKSVGDLKAMKAEKAQGNKRKALDDKKEDLSALLASIHLPESIRVDFPLTSQRTRDKTLLSICDGSIGYAHKKILDNINLSVTSKERVAITGSNGKGKTTLLKALLNDPTVLKSGQWNTPTLDNMGYLDQHYGTLDSEKSALEIFSGMNIFASHAEIRKHLNNFLFRKNEEVCTLVKNLS